MHDHPPESRTRGGAGGEPSLAAPQGRVTLVFTDIEGSTQLWERYPGAMKRALQLHNEALRDLMLGHAAYEVKTEGDAFLLAFQRASDALRWSLAAQRLLLALPWPEALLSDPGAQPVHGEGALLWRGLRVRIGVHTGSPEALRDPRTGLFDYFGSDANLAARACAAGHGGQILCTGPTWQGLSAEERAGLDATVLDLGAYRLRGITEPVRLLQLHPTALAGRRHPRLRTAAVRKCNFEAAPDPFVGREAELRALTEALAGPPGLLTLLAPGGAGKTRLSREAGLRCLARFSEDGGGVWFCDLAAARDLAGVVDAVAQALNLTVDVKRDLATSVEQIGFAIASLGKVLIILDNFEQVAATAHASVGVWARIAAACSFLVTSREPLQLQGERRMRLEPLSQEDALALFEARAAQHGIPPADRDREATLDLLSHLDGLPLAIELAAARRAVLTPSQMISRLARRFDMLRGRVGERGERHATLRAAIDWSWEMLSPEERQCLARASVFRGSFDLEAAEAVLGEPDDGSMVLDQLQALVDRSLVRCFNDPGSPDVVRFQLLESIREYAEPRLLEPAQTLLRHAAWYSSQGMAVAEALRGGEQPTILRPLSLYWDNLAVILRRASGVAGWERVLAMATLAIDPLNARRVPSTDRIRLLDQAAEAAARTGHGALLARLLLARGTARLESGDAAAAAEDFRAILGMEVSEVDTWSRGAALRGLGNGLLEEGRVDEARRVLEQALACCDPVTGRSLEGWVRTSMGMLAWKAGDSSAALSHYRAARAIAAGLADRRHETILLINIGVVCRVMGDLEEAVRCGETARQLAAELEDRRAEALALNNLAILAAQRDALPRAGELFRQALDLFRGLGLRGNEGIVLNNLTHINLILGHLEEARALADAALRIHREKRDRRNEGVVLGLIGDIAERQGRLDEGLRFLDEAVSALSEAGDPRAVAWNRAKRGAVLAALDRVGQAQADLEEAERVLTASGDPTLAATTAVLRGHLDLATARAAVARGEDPTPALAAARARVAAAQASALKAQELSSAAAHLEEAIDAWRAGGAGRGLVGG